MDEDDGALAALLLQRVRRKESARRKTSSRLPVSIASDIMSARNFTRIPSNEIRNSARKTFRICWEFAYETALVIFLAMKKRVLLPDDVCEWIDGAMPEIGGARTVRILRCSSLPFSWLPGFSARFRGLTLWRCVYIHERVGTAEPHNPDWMELLFHELVHVSQFRQRPLLFPLSYLWKLARIGYAQHPAEIEARERGAALSAAFYRWRSSGA